jgi:hypothetical protein
MVKWLQNKNRTDRPKITIETLKETVDQCDLVFLFFFTQFILPDFFRENKKELSHEKIKTNCFLCVF